MTGTVFNLLICATTMTLLFRDSNSVYYALDWFRTCFVDNFHGLLMLVLYLLAVAWFPLVFWRWFQCEISVAVFPRARAMAWFEDVVETDFAVDTPNCCSSSVGFVACWVSCHGLCFVCCFRRPMFQSFLGIYLQCFITCRYKLILLPIFYYIKLYYIM